MSCLGLGVLEAKGGNVKVLVRKKLSVRLERYKMERRQDIKSYRLSRVSYERRINLGRVVKMEF